MGSLREYILKNQEKPEAQKARVPRKQLLEWLAGRDVRFEKPGFLDCEEFFFNKIATHVEILAEGNNEAKLVGFIIG